MNKRSTILSLSVTVFIISITMLTGGCGSSDPTHDIIEAIQKSRSPDISAYLLEQLSSHRMLLLADDAHGQWQPRQTVIDLLETWFRTVATDSNQEQMNRRLALVLEVDSLHLAHAMRYMDSSNPEDILDVGLLCSGVFTTADMEFYWRLGELWTRIKDYNAHHPSSRIDLILVPGEEFINLDEWSFDRRRRYFLYDRDSLVASRIVRFETHHPDYSMVAFYGSAHLQRGIVTKHADDDSTQGRFLASYLDSLLDSTLITAGQVTSDYWGPYRDLFVYADTQYVFPTASPNPDVRRILAGPIRYDIAIVQPKRYLYGTPIAQIPSMNIARIAVSEMPKILNTTGGPPVTPMALRVGLFRYLGASLCHPNAIQGPNAASSPSSQNTKCDCLATR